MEPTLTIVTVQNPGEDSVVFNPQRRLSPDDVVEQYGREIKHGAFVSLIDRDERGNTVGGLILVSDRECDGTLYLQNNEYMTEDNPPSVDVDNIGAVIASGDVPLPQLNTYTVFGADDDGERFVNVCTAETPEEAAAATKTAVVVDDGCDHLVQIYIVLTGDHSDAEAVNV